MLRRTIVFAALFPVWIVLSGNLDGQHLLMGVIACAFVSIISGDLVFQDRRGNPRDLPVIGYRLAGYLCWLLWEVVLSNFHVLRLALSPTGMRDVRPRIVRFQTRLDSPTARYVLANSITLTPGTITVELVGNDLYIHAISEATAKGLEGPMEKKIGRIFGQEL